MIKHDLQSLIVTLIVSLEHLIYRTYKSIGIDVPSYSIYVSEWFVIVLLTTIQSMTNISSATEVTPCLVILP